jgi:fatty-acyl-CoA synthase
MMTTKIISPTLSDYHYQLLIGRMLEQPLKYKPDTEIVYRDKLRYTYRDLYTRVSRLANLLTGALGVRPGGNGWYYRL